MEQRYGETSKQRRKEERDKGRERKIVRAGQAIASTTEHPSHTAYGRTPKSDTVEIDRQLLTLIICLGRCNECPVIAKNNQSPVPMLKKKTAWRHPSIRVNGAKQQSRWLTLMTRYLLI
jgi:hypothetical protein